MRAIDADELYEKLDEIRKKEIALYGVGNSIFCCTLSTALTEINDAPTIEPERKRGKWVDGSIPTYAVCSVCAYQERYAYENNYCPNCGADMREDQDWESD